MKKNESKQIPLELPGDDRPRETAGEGASKSDGPSLEWVSHPARKNMKVAVLTTAFLIILVVVVYFLTYSPWFAILAFIILFGSLLPFYFPTRYRLTDEDIVIKTTAQRLVKKWSQYRTYYPDKNGILLSPFLRPTRLENFRGIYIRFANNKEEVMAFVKRRMEKAKEEGAKES
jgi:hypothetical protein